MELIEVRAPAAGQEELPPLCPHEQGVEELSTSGGGAICRAQPYILEGKRPKGMHRWQAGLPPNQLASLPRGNGCLGGGEEDTPQPTDTSFP